MFAITQKDGLGDRDLVGYPFRSYFGHKASDRHPEKKPESLCHGRDNLSYPQVRLLTVRVGPPVSYRVLTVFLS